MELSLGENTVSVQPISQSSRFTKEVKRLSDARRSDGSPVFAEVTTTHTVVRGKESQASEIVIREPVVGLNGRFIEATVNLRLEKPGVVWVFLSENGSLQLSRHAVDKGFVLYHDMCHGKIDGVKAKKSCWETWEAVRQMRFRGQRADHDALPIEKWAHPEIIRRRKKVRNGVEFLDAKAMEQAIKEAKAAVSSLPAHEQEALSARAAEELGADA